MSNSRLLTTVSLAFGACTADPNLTPSGHLDPSPAKSSAVALRAPAPGGNPDEPPRLEILANGFVFADPLYPYVGHGFLGDRVLGDNDMPWLRDFAAEHGVFTHVNLDQSWKDREWDMIRAIIRFTAYHLSWTEVSTSPPQRRSAKNILAAALEDQSLSWGCGDIAIAAQGLAQAQGIPCRLVNGRLASDPNSGDFCCEMFSTRFNRWVFLMPHCNAWIEHAEDGPLGVRELHEYDVQGLIQTRAYNGNSLAIPVYPLVYKPIRLCRAPLPPYYTARWWAGCFQHFHVGWRSQLNGEVFSNNSVYNDNFLNEYYDLNPPGPVMPIDDLNITYPLNNAECTAELVDAGIRLTLINNMFEFVGYEYQENESFWQVIDEAPSRDGVTTFLWTPDGNATLRIRGMNLAGVHSPDVLISYSITPPTDDNPDS